MTRGLDHLVIAVRDLDEAARLYERMGFQVGARNRHPWGTENRLVQFPGTFLELITVADEGAIQPHGERFFSFGAFVRDYLARREGFAMLVLDSVDAATDADLFARTGIGAFEPFFFERRGRRPDGSDVHVAFTLAFASDDAAPDAGFFVCQQHRPQDFWNPAFQAHPNGAREVSAVALVADDPAAHEGFLTAFSGTDPHRESGALRFALTRGRIDVMTPDAAAAILGSVEPDGGASLVAFSVRVPDIARQGHMLDAARIPFQRIGTRLAVPPSAAHGLAIAFEPL